MSQLGFTFYPKDWWTSDSFFLLQPYERYIYLECLFIMYSQDGWMSDSKLIIERRLLTTIKDEVWEKVTSYFIKDGDKMTHKNVNSRMRKTLANRENGLKGGRPKNQLNTEEEKPKKPKYKTHKNPPLEIEREIEIETENKSISGGIDFEAFINFLNRQTGKNYKLVNDSVKAKFNARFKEGYTKQDILNSIRNAVKDQFHIDSGFKFLTPEYFSRANTLDKHGNAPVKPKKAERPAGVWDV